jgi:hypothetical protein
MSPYEDPQTAFEMERDVIAQDIQLSEERSIAPAGQGQIIGADSATLMQVISRAAADPNTDVDKLERLLGVYERITAKSAEAAYNQSLALMQPELPVIAERGGIKNNTGKVTSTYAYWEDINEAIRPVLAKHGFSLSFRTGQENGQIVVAGVLSHAQGHREETTMYLPVDGSGSKNAVQAVGSSISYGKRYTAAALLNLTSRGEDDDGQKAADSTPAAVVDAINAIQLCTTVDELRKWKVDNEATLKAMPSGQADVVVRSFNTRLRAVKAEAQGAK